MAATENSAVFVEVLDSAQSDASSAEKYRLYGSSHALVIGIDNYTNGWPRLSNAVKDARLVGEALKTYGFEVETLTNATGAELRNALRRFFAVKGADPDARLFVWYAGHGHTDFGEGYLVPADAPLPEDPEFLISALQLRDFGGLVRIAKAKHVLSVFDSCFAGTVFTSQRARPPPAITKASVQPTRQFLTSGDADQQVSDDGTFRRLFISALSGDEPADLNGDGYVTGTELSLFMEDRLVNLTQAQQTPRSGKLRDPRFDRGDFIFVLPQLAALTVPKPAPSAPAQPQAPDPGQSGSIAVEMAFWDAIKSSAEPGDYEAYLEAFPNGNFAPLARARVKSLKAGGESEAAAAEAAKRQQEAEAAAAAKAAEKRKKEAEAAAAAQAAAEQAAAKRRKEAKAAADQAAADQAAAALTEAKAKKQKDLQAQQEALQKQIDEQKRLQAELEKLLAAQQANKEAETAAQAAADSQVAALPSNAGDPVLAETDLTRLQGEWRGAAAGWSVKITISGNQYRIKIYCGTAPFNRVSGTLSETGRITGVARASSRTSAKFDGFLNDLRMPNWNKWNDQCTAVSLNMRHSGSGQSADVFGIFGSSSETVVASTAQQAPAATQSAALPSGDALHTAQEVLDYIGNDRFTFAKKLSRFFRTAQSNQRPEIYRMKVLGVKQDLVLLFISFTSGGTKWNSASYDKDFLLQWQGGELVFLENGTPAHAKFGAK